MKKITVYALLTLIACAAFTPPKLKTLLLLGDSISMQYSPWLEKMVAGTYRIVRKEDSGEGMQNLDIPKGSNIGNSRMALSYIKYKLSDQKYTPDLMVLNCGLHDIKRDPKTAQIAVDTAEYRRNLTAIATLAAQKQIPLIWIRTTEVVDSIHQKNKGFHRYAKDLDTYNTIADEVFQQFHTPSVDLYTFTKGLAPERYVDHVHYNKATQQLQAAYIAGFLNSYYQR